MGRPEQALNTGIGLEIETMDLVSTSGTSLLACSFGNGSSCSGEAPPGDMLDPGSAH